jgi:hypothetical protein
MSDFKLKASTDTSDDFWRLHNNQEQLRVKLPKPPAYPIPLPDEIVSAHFKYIKLATRTTSGGSILGNVPIQDNSSSHFYEASDSMRYGTNSVAGVGNPPSDGLYRQSSLTLWREIFPKREKFAFKTVFLELYNRSIENRLSLEHLDESIKVYGFNAGVTF